MNWHSRLTLRMPVPVLSYSTQDIVETALPFWHNFSLNIFFCRVCMKTYFYSLESHHCIGEMT